MRKGQRYPLALPVKLEWTEPGGRRHRILSWSQDISARGLFVRDCGPLKEKANVRVELSLPHQVDPGERTYMEALGSVVHFRDRGAGIHWGEYYLLQRSANPRSWEVELRE